MAFEQRLMQSAANRLDQGQGRKWNAVISARTDSRQPLATCLPQLRTNYLSGRGTRRANIEIYVSECVTERIVCWRAAITAQLLKSRNGGAP
jgi:hypothetical protein